MSTMTDAVSFKAHAYVVTFISGKSDAVNRIEANLLREGGSLSYCDSALMYIEPALETPRCCKKIGAKAAGLREQVDIEKHNRMKAEALADFRQDKIEFNERTHSMFVRENRATAKLELDTRDKKIKQLEADLAAASKTAPRERVIRAPAPVLAVLKRKVSEAQEEAEAHKSSLDHITAAAFTSATELAAVKGQLAAAKEELGALKKSKSEMAIKHFGTVSKKNGEIATLKKDIQALHSEAAAHQYTATKLTVIEDIHEETKNELYKLKHTLTQLTDEKKDISEKLTVTCRHLEVCTKEAQDTASELVAVKAELGECKKMIRPQKHLSNRITAAKKELEAVKHESQMHQADALAKHMDAVAAKHELAQYQSAYDVSQHNIVSLEANINSLSSTVARTTEALRTTQHELAAAKGEATVTAQDLEMEKQSNTSLAAECTRAQATITDLRSSLEIVKVELAAFKAPEPAASASASAAVPGPPSTKTAAEKLAAWSNAHAVVRVGDKEIDRANEAKTEANKDNTAGIWTTIFRPTGSALANQTKVDAVRAVLDGIEKDLAAKDSAVAALKEALQEEKAAGAERKRELAAARLALESTQGSLRDTRATLALALALALAAAEEKTTAGCGNCAEAERSARLAQAGTDAALMELDAALYERMSSWSLLHDLIWDVEAKLSVRSGTPGASGSTSGESDGSGTTEKGEEEVLEVEIVGGDGEVAGAGWDRNTPPHLRRGGFAGRSLARHMPNLVRK
ncbi:uncharacterized protein CC84DRAFT_1221315 [Paraphaeosphaeria sporulosa]|uniref:Uncharacterized protein n=1 Tax=Paraphaeosphaeria sporulosa TaxID=1460663 RepID=A0A177C244_9PLEO|nr:uncharacterized protein CC84DRAFT_1221315 [Paraphaeosphaeria sporulosa]OAG01854.1 hypothetical protein CC84DRAFT_1221315 [Paraphaeosphaeria sporulosa]